MERDQNPTMSYEAFLALGRHLAQLELAVCEVFGMPMSKYSAQDAAISEARESYQRISTSFSRKLVVDHMKLRLHDDVLDFMITPDKMDWEDFSELVEEVIDTIWRHIDTIKHDTTETLLASL